MKKTTLILTFILIGLANKAMCQSSYLVNENFDSYSVGTFPSTWTLTYPGYGTSLQVVSNSTSVSGSNSLKLEGAVGNAANADFNLSSTPDIVWLEVMVNPSKLEVPYYQYYPIAVVGLNNEAGSSWGNGYGCVYFTNGSIYAGGPTATVLQTFNEGQWYKVKIKYYAALNKMDVWIDDVSKASGVALSGNSPKYNAALLVGSNACHTKCFFDNVKVWDDNAVTTGINEINSTPSIQIYPNPATDKITVKAPIVSPDQFISIYDITGHLLLQQPLKEETTDIDISSLSKGVYVAKMGDKKSSTSQRWVKE